MNINRQDLLWNYAATFIRMAASLVLLPFVLKHMSPETVGVWTAFVTVNSTIIIFDFGFNPSFTRNITYIYSGVEELKATGLQLPAQETTRIIVNQSLLGDVISAMKLHYRRMALIFLLLMSVAGTVYIYFLLRNYSQNTLPVYIAWALLCLINTFNLYSFYYDCLLQGKGLIKRSRQIVVVSQLAYLLVAIVLLKTGFGLIAVAAAQGVGVVIVRWLSHRIFFSAEERGLLSKIPGRPASVTMKSIYPNAFRVGITGFGIWMAQRAALIIGSFFLSLPEIASFGITMQVTGVFSMLGGIYHLTYQPKVIQLLVKNDIEQVKRIYLKGLLLQVLFFVTGGTLLVLLGNQALQLIGSKTVLLPGALLCVCLLLSFEQTFFLQAANFLSLKNEAPFYKSSVITGIGVILCTLLFFILFKASVVWLIIIPLVADLVYQSWKWPLEAARVLRYRFSDVIVALYPANRKTTMVSKH